MVKKKPSPVQEAADLILNKFNYTHPFTYPYRFGLAIGQRVSFSNIELTAPSLDIGVNDGSTARIIHYGKPRITWGGDMPEESTYESKGLFVTPDFNIYDNLLGMDACDLPFPASSFNTVVATEVFSYGMDRRRLLSEVVRVLAPGGTLAFTDNSQEILKFPILTAELKKFVLDLNILDNPRECYHQILSELGMTDFFFRPFFDRSLAALTFSLIYAYPAKAKGEYYELVIDDPYYRSIHKECLLAIAHGMEDEFRNIEGPKGGWHVFVSCKKPGELSTDLPPPQPCCLICGEMTLERSLWHCACRSCGQSYEVRFGIPYLLRNYKTSYSPKVGRKATPSLITEKQIDLALRRFYEKTAASLGPNAKIFLLDIDPSTQYIIRHMQQNGIEILAVCSGNRPYIGEKIGGLDIIGPDELTNVKSDIFISAFTTPDSRFIKEIRDSGYEGRIFFIAGGREAYGVSEVKKPNIVRRFLRRTQFSTVRRRKTALTSKTPL